MDCLRTAGRYQQHNRKVGSSRTQLSALSTPYHPQKNISLNNNNNNNNKLSNGDRRSGTHNISDIKVEMFNNGSFKKQQLLLTRFLKFLPLSATYEQFQDGLFNLLEITETRYDLLGFAHHLTNVKYKGFCRGDIRLFNQAVRIAIDKEQRGLYTHRLDKESFHLVLFTNVRFASSRSSVAKMSFVIFVVDNSTRANWLRCLSYDVKLSERSNLHAETYAFIKAMKITTPICEELQKLVNKKVPLFILTDSNYLINVMSTQLLSSLQNVSKNCELKDCELRMDIESIEQALLRDDIHNVGRIKTEHNIAASFQRLGHCEPLESLLDNGTLNMQVDGWVTDLPEDQDQDPDEPNSDNADVNSGNEVEFSNFLQEEDGIDMNNNSFNDGGGNTGYTHSGAENGSGGMKNYSSHSSVDFHQEHDDEDRSFGGHVRSDKGSQFRKYNMDRAIFNNVNSGRRHVYNIHNNKKQYKRTKGVNVKNFSDQSKNGHGNGGNGIEEFANNDFGLRNYRHYGNDTRDDEDACTDELLFGTFVTAERRLEMHDEGTCSRTTQYVLKWRNENEGAQGYYNSRR